MNRETRLARANEIFARVWPEDRDDTLYDVAEEARAEFLNIADDFTAALEELREVQSRLPGVEEDEDGEFTDLDIMRYRLDDIEAWIKPMRELAGRLETALEVAHALERTA